MANKVQPRVLASITSELEKALDDGYRTSRSDMFKMFLSEIMCIWGYPEWWQTSGEALPAIRRAVGLYDEAVRSADLFDDLLGPIYMGLVEKGTRKALDQFFTPQPVARMLAISTIGHCSPKSDGTMHKVWDPAVGSGVLLLAAAQHIAATGGHAALEWYSLGGCDLSPVCARMTAVQLVAGCAVHQVKLGEIIVLEGDSRLGPEKANLLLHATSRPIKQQRGGSRAVSS